MPSSAGRARFQLCGKVSVPRGFIPVNVGRGRIARTRKGKGGREIRNRVVHFDPVRNSAYRRRGRASTVTSNSPENIIRGRNSPPPPPRKAARDTRERNSWTRIRIRIKREFCSGIRERPSGAIYRVAGADTAHARPGRRVWSRRSGPAERRTSGRITSAYFGTLRQTPCPPAPQPCGNRGPFSVPSTSNATRHR